MTGIPQRWADRARYDLETAKAMLEKERLLYVLFCCQQAVEKMLKGLFARRKGELPPRTHQLVRLAEAANVRLTEEQADLLRELSAYYIQSRYPDEIEDAGSQLSRKMAGDVLSRTEEIMQWLSSMMQ